MKPLFIPVLIVVIFLYSCRSDRIESTNPSALSPEYGDSLNGSAENIFERIDIPLGMASIKPEAHYLYGRFYNNEAEFYIIEEPEITLAGSSVKQLTLYYVGDILCKKKYHVDADLSTYLINKYKRFNFVPADGANKDLSKAHEVVQTQENLSEVNDTFNHYTLKIYLNDRTIRYFYKGTNPDTIEMTYSEELPNYDQVFRMMEAGR